MHFMATVDTDVGISKDTNQDSILIKHASVAEGEVLLAVVCDGMGGLSKGELASATVIKEFSDWFTKELPRELKHLDMRVIAGKWTLMIKDLNIKIMEYGKSIGVTLGTTFTGILFIQGQYMIAHVGDTRAYQFTAEIEQLTQDQTYVAREVARGNMTMEDAKTDRRRNMLLQCIGASNTVEPQIIYGNTCKGTYMLCSDGFRHEISDTEMFDMLAPGKLVDKSTMHKNARYLIELVKSREERDNISVVLIKTN